MLLANWSSRKNLEKTVAFFKKNFLYSYNSLCSTSIGVIEPYDYQEEFFDSLIRNFLTRKYENIQISGSRQTGKTFMSQVFLVSSLLCLPHLMNVLKTKGYVLNFDATYSVYNNNFSVIVPNNIAPLFTRIKNDIDKIKINKKLIQEINMLKLISNKKSIILDVGIKEGEEENIYSTSVEFIINKNSDEKQGPTCSVNFFDEAQIMKNTTKKNSFDPTLTTTNGFSVIMGKGIEDDECIMKKVKIENNKIKIKELEQNDKEGFKNLFHNTFSINKLNKNPIIPDGFVYPKTIGTTIPTTLDETQMLNIIKSNKITDKTITDFMTNYLAIDLTLVGKKVVKNKYQMFIEEYKNFNEANLIYEQYFNKINKVSYGKEFNHSYFIGIDIGYGRSSTVIIVIMYLEDKKTFVIVDLVEMKKMKDNRLMNIEERIKTKNEYVDRIIDRIKYFILKRKCFISVDYHTGVSEELINLIINRYSYREFYSPPKEPVSYYFNVYYGNDVEKQKQFNFLYEVLEKKGLFCLPQLKKTDGFYKFASKMNKLNEELSKLKLIEEAGKVVVKWGRKLDNNRMDLTDALRYAMAGYMKLAKKGFY